MAPLPVRVSMPATARAGDIVEVRVLARHPMERGGEAPGRGTLRRQIIHSFLASFAGEEVIRMELSPGISANPFIAFSFVATKTGELTCEWHEDGGQVTTRSQMLTVT